MKLDRIGGIARLRARAVQGAALGTVGGAPGFATATYVGNAGNSADQSYAVLALPVGAVVAARWFSWPASSPARRSATRAVGRRCWCRPARIVAPPPPSPSSWARARADRGDWAERPLRARRGFQISRSGASPFRERSAFTFDQEV
jgi:hypothetical protein